jgi:signal transduction histidine kinase
MNACQNANADAAGLLGRRYLKRQALFSAAVCFFLTVVFFFLPSFPFDRRMLWYTLAAGAVYLAVFFTCGSLGKGYSRLITFVSLFGLAGSSVVIHLTGGIMSPFIFMYFAILISEAAYGDEQFISISAAALFFLLVIGGEATGVLTPSPAAVPIYASLLTTLVVTATIAAFMFITGYIGRIIIKQLRTAVDAENSEKQAILSKLGELEAHSQIGVLAHRIVHDLRNPIASISGYIQMEMIKVKTEEDKEMLKELNEVVLSMSSALKGITQFGRVACGPAENIVLSDFMRTLVAIVSFSPQARGVKFIKLYPEKLPLAVCGCRADLQQAFFNIIRNAVEAVRDNAGARTVEISIKAVGKEAEVSIQDNGPGMDPEVLKNLFRKSITTKKDGTGVGLVITRDLLARNSGDIEFHNLPAGGMWVLTRFPLA